MVAIALDESTRRARVAKRKADGVCVCCGAPWYEAGGLTLECGCYFCQLWTEKGHASHEAAFAVWCPGPSSGVGP